MNAQVARGPLAYQRKFTLDIAQSAFAFAPGWGSFGGIQVALSDMLGNQHYYFLLANTAESSDEFLERFNVGGTYLNFTHRLNYGYGAFRFAGRFVDFIRDELFYERTHGIYGLFSYPVSKYYRIETGMSFMKSYREEYCIPAVFLRGSGLGWLTMATAWGYPPLMAPYSLMKDMLLTRLSTVEHWDCFPRTLLGEVSNNQVT